MGQVVFALPFHGASDTNGNKKWNWPTNYYLPTFSSVLMNFKLP